MSIDALSHLNAQKIGPMNDVNRLSRKILCWCSIPGSQTIPLSSRPPWLQQLLFLLSVDYQHRKLACQWISSMPLHHQGHLAFSKILKLEQPMWYSNWGIDPTGKLDEPLYGSSTTGAHLHCKFSKDWLQRNTRWWHLQGCSQLSRFDQFLILVRLLQDRLFGLAQWSVVKGWNGVCFWFHRGSSESTLIK